MKSKRKSFFSTSTLLCLSLILTILSISACAKKKRPDHGTLQLAPAGGLIFHTETGQIYSLYLEPNYHYFDQTGKCPATYDGKMQLIVVGNDGLYRCQGKIMSVDEFKAKMKAEGMMAKLNEEKISQTKKRQNNLGEPIFLYGMQFVMAVQQIELLKVKENRK